MLLFQPRDSSRPTSWQSVVVIFVALVAGLLLSLVGRHALESRLGPWPALLVSHGGGLLVLFLVLRLGLRRWPPRSSRSTPPPAA